MVNSAEQLVTLPTAALLKVAVICGLLGGAIAGGAMAGGAAMGLAWAGTGAAAALCGAAIVLGSTIGAILLMQPWRARALHRWPLVWIVASMGRMLVTLGLGILLYSATPLGTAGLWLGIVVSYAATLVGETRVYAAHMRRFSPAGAAPAATVRPAGPSRSVL